MPLAPKYTAVNFHSTGEDLDQLLEPEGNGEIFRPGDPVYSDANGFIRACGAPGTLLNSNGNKPLGIAGDTGHNDAVSGTHQVRVTRIDGSARGIAPVSHGTASLAVTAQAHLTKTFQLLINPAGQQGGVSVAIDQPTLPIVQVEDIAGDYPTGTQYGYERFRWLTSALQSA